MIINIELKGKKYRTNLNRGIDLSSTLAKPGKEIKAWYVEESKKEAVTGDGWVGSVKEGSSVNFFNIMFNPHGNGTHTESYGHISEAWENVNDQLDHYHFIALFLEIEPEERDGDKVISWDSIKDKIPHWEFDALIIKAGNYMEGHNFSNTNPPYFDAVVMDRIREGNVQHLLTDLPSVDREEDGGKMAAHKAFWNYPENPREGATISELLNIPSGIAEGLYLLNLQLAPFHNDATPSRPVIYSLEEV